MKDKWIVIIAVAALGGVGYLYWKDKKATASGASGQTAAGGILNILSPQPLANSSIGSYVDPTGGMDYVDAVPVSVTSPTGFTAADYNYGVVDEQPENQTGNGYDVVANPDGSGNTTIVPTGIGSYNSYEGIVG